jgi:nucleoporin NDC1
MASRVRRPKTWFVVLFKYQCPIPVTCTNYHLQAYATWELALIARDFEARRKGIFEDIDRKEGPMWSQIYVLELENLKALEKRMDDYGKPPAPPPVAQEKPGPQPPTRVVEPPISADVWVKSKPKTFSDTVGKYVADVAKLPGKKTEDTLVPLAKRTLADIKDALLSKGQQEKIEREGLLGVYHSVYNRVIRTPTLGWLFRQTYSRRLTNAVMAFPNSEISVYVNSAFILSELAVTSLSEDSYGNVHRDVPSIIRTLTAVIRKLEVFRDSFPVHWTDVDVKRDCKPVDELLDALKQALERVVAGFEPYASDLRLTRTDLRLAKEAAQRQIQEQPQSGAGSRTEIQDQVQPEMEQVR